MESLNKAITELQELNKIEGDMWQACALQYLLLAKSLLYKDKNVPPFSREELIHIRERSLHFSFPHKEPISPLWAKAYENLASASDYLDALNARTQVQSNSES